MVNLCLAATWPSYTPGEPYIKSYISHILYRPFVSLKANLCVEL